MADVPEGFELVDDVPSGFEVLPAPEAQQSIGQKIDEAIFSVPGGRELTQIASKANKSVLEFVDFLGVDAVNDLIRMAGGQAQITPLAQTAEELGIGADFVEPGFKRDILTGVGEVIPAALTLGSGLRTAASKLPAMTAASEGVIPGIVRQMGKTTAGGDVALGATSAVGAATGEEVGGDTGAVLGAFLAPIGAVGAKGAITNLFNKGAAGVKGLFTGISQSTANMSDDGAATLLGEAMVREGISPDDAIARLNQLGPEALPADISNGFARLLNAASRKIPRIEGRAGQIFSERNKGQASRVVDALDDASGTSSLSLDDEIARLDNFYKPQIQKLYGDARAVEFTPSQSLTTLMEKSPTIRQAKSRANIALQNREALGETPGGIDIVDETKRELDNIIGKAIRLGENNKAMDAVKLKNALIDEADKAVPKYKEARDLFAGKKQLEQAGELGEQFFKLKSAEIARLTEKMSVSEKKLFNLGAKQAIIDKVEGLQTNANAVKRLFGKNGDIAKLKSLFDSPDDFKRFESAMDRESNFILTRNAAQKTSGTPQQIHDIQTGDEALSTARGLIDATDRPITFLTRLASGLRSKKGTPDAERAWREAGDILLESGMNQDKLLSILKQGSAKQVEKELKNIFKVPQTQKLIDIQRAVLPQQLEAE